MVSRRVLACFCMATLLVGTQAAAENTGVDSVAGALKNTATSVVVEDDISSEATQVQLIEQAIREVEAQVKQQKAGSAEQPSSSVSTSQKVLEKVTPVLQYQPEPQPDFAQSEQGSDVVQAAQQTLYQGGAELSAALPKAPLFSKEGFELENVAPFEPGYIQKYEHGAINWLTGTVTATGESLSTGLAVSSRQARLKTLRAATIDARKNLFTILNGIPVTEKMRIKNILRADEDVMQFVRGDMQNSRITATSFTEDGVANVTVSITLRDMFLEKLIGKHVSFHRVSDNPYSAANAVAESIENAVASDTSSEEPIGLPIAYTGLLIDAREVGIQPAITVTIADEAGNVLYSPRVVNRNVALRNGMVEYAGTWEEAIASERSSSNPLVLKAVSVQGKTRSNIVISNEQAQLLKQINNAHNFLEKGRVVVVCK
ncbi:hypothetical protein [Halodesulfovibrio sp.]|uniref:hypothetical protein n=1 Tax=Halodesulfovibrio sp. TaxID=1912772 RepID=UPI0025BD57A0|nr:hypothetical protein [Halodesulfovibrio sp.]